jgi:uncharacterized protein YjbI with pentapeptide repeats
MPTQHFLSQNYKDTPLEQGEYEDCTFTNCNFFEADMSRVKFLDCSFEGCNLSMAKIVGTVFNDVVFKNCKILGLGFEHASAFGLSLRFENCVMDHCSFFQMKLKKTTFLGCQIHEADFTETDLTSSVFKDCDLTGSVFFQSVLEKTDFRSATNYAINLEVNKVKKTRFSQDGLAGLVTQYDIEIDG